MAEGTLIQYQDEAAKEKNQAWLVGEYDAWNLKNRDQLRDLAAYEQQQAIDQGKRLASATPYVNTQANQALAGKVMQEQGRGLISNAAERGLLRSGTFAQIQGRMAGTAALSQAGLVADEYARRKAELQAMQSNVGALNRSLQEIGTYAADARFVYANGIGPVEQVTFGAKEVKRQELAQRELQAITTNVIKNQPSEEEMFNSLNSTIMAKAEQSKQKVIAYYRAVGGDPTAALGLIDQEMASASTQVSNIASQLATGDPNKVSAALQSLITPDKVSIDAEDDDQSFWDWLNLGLTVAGAAGGAAIGGFGGASAGAAMGSQGANLLEGLARG